MVDEGVDLLRLLAAGFHLRRRERKSEGEGRSIRQCSSALAIAAEAYSVRCDSGFRGGARLSELETLSAEQNAALRRNKGLQVQTVLLPVLKKKSRLSKSNGNSSSRTHLSSDHLRFLSFVRLI